MWIRVILQALNAKVPMNEGGGLCALDTTWSRRKLYTPTYVNELNSFVCLELVFRDS